jgi:hypothetical protein
VPAFLKLLTAEATLLFAGGLTGELGADFGAGLLLGYSFATSECFVELSRYKTSKHQLIAILNPNFPTARTFFAS